MWSLGRILFLGFFNLKKVFLIYIYIYQSKYFIYIYIYNHHVCIYCKIWREDRNYYHYYYYYYSKNYMVRWVVGSIFHGGTIELFHVVCVILSVG